MAGKNANKMEPQLSMGSGLLAQVDDVQVQNPEIMQSYSRLRALKLNENFVQEMIKSNVEIST